MRSRRSARPSKAPARLSAPRPRLAVAERGGRRRPRGGSRDPRDARDARERHEHSRGRHHARGRGRRAARVSSALPHQRGGLVRARRHRCDAARSTSPRALRGLDWPSHHRGGEEVGDDEFSRRNRNESVVGPYSCGYLVRTRSNHRFHMNTPLAQILGDGVAHTIALSVRVTSRRATRRITRWCACREARRRCLCSCRTTRCGAMRRAPALDPRDRRSSDFCCPYLCRDDAAVFGGRGEEVQTRPQKFSRTIARTCARASTTRAWCRAPRSCRRRSCPAQARP